ncbi:MAG: biopolymer transporter ExbD [Candidatus Tectomicrobia bacterium]|uniref:Biopolymer transporter ExbD n=1 Tax=Tectimicrobiota bacterium TaxID=2528274 RepID=A0A932CP03_UNCTE|nr:biopolymer transporter ExbD [Candidatus Tectomicrobia bacterium]
MRFRKEEEEEYGLNMTPMIDVVFNLLIFFMVATSFVDFSRRLDIELPEAKAAQVQERVRHFTVEIGLDERIYLNGKEVSLDGLESAMRAPILPGQRRSVIIKADKRLSYGRVVEVMGISKAAGITDIGIAIK